MLGRGGRSSLSNPPTRPVRFSVRSIGLHVAAAAGHPKYYVHSSVKRLLQISSKSIPLGERVGEKTAQTRTDWKKKTRFHSVPIQSMHVQYVYRVS